MANLHTETLDQLISAIAKLNTVEECSAFLEDLCTIRELKDLSQRLNVARLLDQGKNYQEVAAETGVSSTTISRVKRCLEYGSGGYRLALDKMEKEAKKA